MTALAERIVTLLDAIGSRYHDSEDPEIHALAENARARYGELKRNYDFTTAARIARSEAVEQLLALDASQRRV